jgi:hypothetical protein
MVDGMCAEAGSTDLVGILEAYFGSGKHSYNVILMPLAVELGFGTRVEQTKGAWAIYHMMGRSSVKNGAPVFGRGGIFALRTIVWHEFGHSFVNPLTEAHRAEVMKYESLFAPIAAAMQRQAYSWEPAVNEHIIRAITSRLATKVVGEEVGASELQADKRNGFMYIEPLAERLKEYESHRDRYPTFASFYPRLLDVFREEQEKAASRH